MDDNKKGFDVTYVTPEDSEIDTTDPGTAMHKGLDVLLKEIEENHLVGAKMVIGAEPTCEHPEHKPREYTLAVFESTNQKDCVWCNGTGVEGS